MVEFKLIGYLARFKPPGDVTTVAAGQRVWEVALSLGIPPEQLVVSVVNGQTCGQDYVLAPGDQLTLVPAIAGGFS